MGFIHGGIGVTSSDVHDTSGPEAGAHPRDLYRWRDEGDAIELSRGVFRHADAPEPSFPDLLAVGMRAPEAIVCCVSAAVAHGLSDEMEPAVQIEVGLSQVEAAPGEFVRIYEPARTVVDLMRLRHRRANRWLTWC